MRLVALLGLTLTCGALGSSCGGAEQRGPVSETVTPTIVTVDAPQPRQPEFYAPDSPWNTPIPADAALDPRSEAYVQSLTRQVRTDGATIMTTEYSMPLYRVGPDQPRVRVELTRNAPALQEAFEEVPLPDDPRPADGTDGGLLVYQRSSDTIWEFWRFRRTAGGYEADWGGRMAEASRSPGYFRRRTRPLVEKPFWGFTATSIGGAAGIMTLEELRRGRVDHVLYLTIPDARRGVCAHPATRTDGQVDDEDEIPEGARFRLDPALDVDALDAPSMTKIMARAAQRYGVVVANRGGAVGFAAEDPAQYGGDPYAELREGHSPYAIAMAFPFERLQVPALRLRRC